MEKVQAIMDVEAGEWCIHGLEHIDCTPSAHKHTTKISSQAPFDLNSTNNVKEQIGKIKIPHI